MSSGQRRVDFNNLEKALSQDFDKIQDYAAAHANNAFLRRFSRGSTGFRPMRRQVYDALSAAPAGTHGTVHDVYGGLFVNCDNSSYLLVSAGTAGFVAPGFDDQGADDSVYVLVSDEGVSSTGVLTFSENSSGSPRVDVVECRPVAESVSEPRDIWNPSTKQFDTISVVKRRWTKLEYRIRLGTAGSGFPSVDQNWLPLAVCVVPSGASGFTESHFWDVRPLLEQRAPSIFGQGGPTDGSWAPVGAQMMERIVGPTSTAEQVAGSFRAIFRGYFCGGDIWENSATTLASFANANEYLRLNQAQNHASGSSAPVGAEGHLNAVVAVFPMGLPRWVRYSTSSIGSTDFPAQNQKLGRLPTGTSGILVFGKPLDLEPSGECRIAGMPTTFGNATGNFPGIVVSWARYSDAGEHVPISVMGKKHTVFLSGADLYQTWTKVGSFPGAALNYTTMISGTPVAPIWGSGSGHSPPATASVVDLELIIDFAISNNSKLTGVSVRRNQSGASRRYLASTYDAVSAPGFNRRYVFGVDMNRKGFSTSLEFASTLAGEPATSGDVSHRILGWTDI